MAAKSSRQLRLCVTYAFAQAILLSLFYWPWLTGQACYYFRDMPHYIEPFCRFVGDSLRHFKIPLWNPWQYCGMSQIAISIHNPLYPPTWFFAWMPFSQAVAANIMFQQVVAGLGGLLLVLRLGWGVIPAIACGLTLAMSGYMFSVVCNFSVPATCSWLPLCLWSLWSIKLPPPPALGQVNKRRVVLAVLVVALMVCTGQPEMVAIILGMLGTFTLVAAIWRRRQDPGDKRWQVDLSWRVRTLCLGVFLAMPLILPSVEWLVLSRRAGGLQPGEVLILSANWYDLICMILPQPLGDLQLKWSEFRSFIMGGSLVPYVPAAFVGPVAFSLALWGASDRSWRQRWLLVGALLLVVGVALGANGPIMPFVLQVCPSLSIARFPVKLLFFAVMCVAILAARGMRSLARGNSSPIVPGLVWGALLIATVPYTIQAIAISSFPGQIHTPSELMTLALVKISHQMVTAAVIGLGIAAAGWYCQRHKKARRVVSFVLTGLLAGSLLFYAMLCCKNTTSPSFYQEPSRIAQTIKEYRAHGVGKTSAEAKVPDVGKYGQRSLGLYMDHFSVPLNLLSKDPLPATVQAYQYSRQVLRPNTNIDFDELSSFGFEGTTPGDYYYFVLNSYLKSSQAFGHNEANSDDSAIARLCQLTATDYVLTQLQRFADDGEPVPSVKPDRQYFALLSEDAELNVGIYRVLETLPRAYFSDCWEWSDSPVAVIETMFNAAKTHFNPLFKTILLKAPGVPTMTMEAVEVSRSTGVPVEITHDDPESVTITVNANRRGYLVLADQYYPGWTADIDGQSTPIIVANGFTRAVAVPTAGPHTVHFRYQPQSFYLGCLISLASLIWLILALRRQDGKIQ